MSRRHERPQDLTACLVEMAGRQHGLVTRRQILDTGIAEGALKGRREAGWLLPVAPGVYAVGRELVTDESVWLAAVLAAGSGACLARRSAGALWGVLNWKSPVEVLVPVTGRKHLIHLKPPGVRREVPVNVLYSRSLPRSSVTTLRGIPVTSAGRSQSDLAAVLSESQLKYSFNESDRRGLLNQKELVDLVRAGRGRKGSGRFRHLVDTRHPETATTRSELEVMFLELCRSKKLLLPEINQVVSGFEVDCLWRDQKVIVELDGFEFHRGAMAFHRDARRDQILHLAGYSVTRVTHPMVREQADDVAASVLMELESRANGH